MQSYSDPDGSPVFGHESGESTSVRSAFDDVDDYDGWNASPPQYRDGTVIPDRTNWRQRVTVTYVVADEPRRQTSATDQGVKRIHVTIEYQNQVLADQIRRPHRYRREITRCIAATRNRKLQSAIGVAPAEFTSPCSAAR